MRRLPILAGVLLALLHVGAPRAQSFEGLGNLPGGSPISAYAVSGDGLVVVGSGINAVGRPEAARWQAGVVQGLGYFDPVGPGPYNLPSSTAVGISDDGTVIVGSSVYLNEPSTPLYPQAVRWAGGAPVEGLGFLPGGAISRAYAVSADGTVIVGTGNRNSTNEPFRWENGQMQGLGHLPSAIATDALDVSTDGQVVVGRSGDAGAALEAFRWEDGQMMGLGFLPGHTKSAAAAVSADGRVIVGTSSVGSDSQAFRWEDGEMEDLGLPSTCDSSASGVSGDGTVIVGRSVCPGIGSVAFVWTEATGARPVKEVLEGYGLDLTGWTLSAANDVSADGRVIVGQGSRSGGTEAWRAVLGEGDDIVVTVTGDEPNDPASQTSNVCDADRTEEGAQCTLRAAIELANARGGATITFDIPGGGVPSIAVPAEEVADQLPAFATPIVLDGTTQPGGWVEVTRGSSDGSVIDVSGITVGPEAGGSVIRGLVVNRFGNYGIHVQDGADGCTIEDNRVGTDAAGLRARANGYAFALVENTLRGGGVRVDSDANEIRDNLLAGNWTWDHQPGRCCGGVDLWLGPTASLNRVYRNDFGTTVNGDPILLNEPNSLGQGYLYLGLFLQGDDNVVGGSEADANVFNGTVMGVIILGDDNEVSHNRIGPPDPSGITAETFPLHANGIALGVDSGLQGTANGTQIRANTVIVADQALGILGDGNTARENTLTGQVSYGPRLDSHARRNLQNTVTVDGVDNVLELNVISSRVWGINVHEGTGNRIERNTIEAGWGGVGFHANVPPDEHAEALITANNITATHFGIDFGGESYVPNDVTDSDTGPNTLLNYPAVMQATWDGQALSVEGFVPTPLVSTATYTIEVFGARACASSPPPANGNPGGGPGATPLFASGEQYIGRVDVPAWLGEAEFSLALDAPAGHPVITLTASRHDLGVTSHFGRCVRPTPADQTARAEVDPDETGLALNAQGVTITVMQAAASSGARPSGGEGGTLYLTRYQVAPDTGVFADTTATAPDGSVVHPTAVAPAYWWLSDRHLTVEGGAEASEVRFSVCLAHEGRVLDGWRDRVVLVQRSLATEGFWRPLDTELEASSAGERLCARDLATLGEFGFGGAEAAFPVGVEDGMPSDVPPVLTLTAFPNPSRQTATLSLSLPVAGVATLEVFDALGRRVARVHDGETAAGTHAFALNTASMPAGVYVARVLTPTSTVSQRLTVVR